MEIKRSGSQPSGKGPADWFTGTVRIDPLFSPPDPARVTGAHVTFEPGARTAWHTHPLGQTLIVTAGCGRVQRDGRPDRGDPAGRRRLVPARRKALARRGADHRHDPYRHHREARRQGRRLAGEGQRRAIPGLASDDLGSDRPTRYREPLSSREIARARRANPRLSGIELRLRRSYTSRTPVRRNPQFLAGRVIHARQHQRDLVIVPVSLA